MSINFVMTDSTNHNLGVIDTVCEDLQTESKPKSIVCNVHLLMMIQRKVKKVFQDIHDALGKVKIKDCFLVDIEFHSESFIIKAITCLSSFINKDFSAKPWNRQSHFESYIAPKKNESISFKDHRFNRIFDCVIALLYHLDDIKAYLEKFQNIINGVSILNRAFLDMELLKPIFCATSLIGIHVTTPLLALMLNKETTHSKLKTIFQDLYKDLTTKQSTEFLQTKKPAATFTTSKLFKKCLPKDHMVASIDSCIDGHSAQIDPLIKLFLKQIAHGLSEQKGAIFGFGPHAEEDTGKLLKISEISETEMTELDKVAIHNLEQERSVGFVNYELGIRGKRNLECSSKKMVLNKSADLLSDSRKLKSFRKPSLAIKEIKLKWNTKMKAYEEKGFSEKEALNLKEEASKIKDLDFLKKQTPPGPFTTSNEVTTYMANDNLTNNEKNKRLYVEVRYARKTSLALKPTAAVFRLKKDHKNLTNEEYTENLAYYLDSSKSATNLTINDLNNVLHALTESENQEPATSSSIEAVSEEPTYRIGEHVAAFWVNDFGVREWFLGIIENIISSKTLSVSYLKRMGSNGKNWVFPEESEILNTDVDQLLAKSICTRYFCCTRIRCSLEGETVNAIEDALKQHQL